jgi:hypothetical protein
LYFLLLLLLIIVILLRLIVTITITIIIIIIIARRSGRVGEVLGAGGEELDYEGKARLLKCVI